MAVLLAFGCGVGACMVLLALGAFLLTHTGLPLAAVRPMACMAAAIGAAVSARVLAGRLKQKLLLLKRLLLLKQPRLLLKHNSHLYFKRVNSSEKSGEFFYIQVHLWLSSNYKKDSFHTELP